MTGTQRRGGLGRGLGALLPSAPAEDLTAAPTGRGTAGLSWPGAPPAGGDDALPRGGPGSPVLREVGLSEVEPNPRQPRSDFDEQAMAELVHSIREIGVLQPIVVRPLAAGRYQLVMGERRWRAAQQAGLASMPAIVRHTDDEAMLRDALLENLHRQQLNPLEEAAAYQQLLAEFDVTHEELATRLGRSRPQVSNTIRLLNLPPGVQRRVAAGVLSAGHARALLGLATAADQDQLASRIVAEGLSVRAVEEIVAVGMPRSGVGEADPASPVADAATELASAPDSLHRETVHHHAARRLADRLDTRVRVQRGRGKGRITVEFADETDLARLVELIAAPQAGEPSW